METEYATFVQQRGRSLAPAGVNSFGFDRNAAIEALQIIRRSSMAVLGGDVYSADNGSLRLTYDSWATDRKPAESFEEFQVRSLFSAHRYISNYKEPKQGTTLYALVVGEGKGAR